MLRGLFLKLPLLPIPRVKTLPGGISAYLLCGNLGDCRLFPLCMQSCMMLVSLFTLAQCGHPTAGDGEGGTQGEKAVTANTEQFPLLKWHELTV